MTQQFENFVNAALDKSLASDVTLPTANKIPVFTGLGRQVTGKAASELGLVTPSNLTVAINNALSSVYEFQTTYNPQTTGQFPTTANTVGGVAIKKGFTWVVSGVTGQYTFQGVTVNNGDTLLALVDNASATSAADWHITESNLGYTPENQNNKDTDGTLAANSDTKYPSQKAVKTYADTKQAALADVVTAGTYGNSTKYPVITFNTKGIATGVTLQTVSVAEVSDSVFRIVDNTDSTKKIAFQASGIDTEQTKTITMPNANVDLGQVGSLNSIKITPVDSANYVLQSNKLYHLGMPLTGVSSYTFILPSTPVSGDIIEIHDSIGVFGASTSLIFRANKSFTFPIGVTGSVSGSAPNIEWTDTRRATHKKWKFTYFSDYGGFWKVDESDSGGCRSPELSVMRKANSIVGVVPNIDAVSSTNKTITYPNRDVDLGLVGQTDFLDTVFRVSDELDATKKIAFQASSITTGQTRTITMPDVDVDLGNLSSVATTDSNTLSGTRTRIVGGSSNTVSGTDVVAIGCNGCDLTQYLDSVTAIGLKNTTNTHSVAPRHAILLGSSALTAMAIFDISGAHAAALGVIQCVYSDVCQANGTTYNATLNGVNTPSSTNCIKLMPEVNTLSSAVIDLDFIIVVGDTMSGAMLAPRRTIFAKRRVYVVFAFNNSDVSAFSSSTEVIGTDTSVGSAATGTVTIGVTVDSANNRLIPTVSATSGTKQTVFQFGVRSTAHYNRNV